MTPKEKAKELVQKFAYYTLMDFNNEAKFPKECALIAVDEILNEYWLHDTEREKFWQEVKQEIEKL